MNTINNRITEIKEQIDHLVDSLNGSYALSFYDDYSDDFATNEYLSDMIMEYADSQVDIYYSKLADWIRVRSEAVDYIQQAFVEGFVDGAKQDIYQIIQAGQYLFYSDEIYTDFSTLEQLHKLHRQLLELDVLEQAT